MFKKTDPSGHSAAAAARGATVGAGAGAAEAAPKARASGSSLHAQIASGTKRLLTRDVSSMDLSPLFTSENKLKKDGSDLMREDVLRAYFTNAPAEIQAKIMSLLTSLFHEDCTISQDVGETIAMKMIPDDFMIAYLSETVASEKLEDALQVSGFINQGFVDCTMALRAKISKKKAPDELSWSGKKLILLPKELGSFITLTQLYLENNKLTHVPSYIFELTGLKTLFLSNNELVELPPAIARLTQLQNLALDSNNLTELPEEIETLGKQLTDFSCAKNFLTALPAALNRWRGLLHNQRTQD